MLFSAFDKAKEFSRNVSRDSYCDGSDISLPVFPSKTNLKMQNIYVTPKLVNFKGKSAIKQVNLGVLRFCLWQALKFHVLVIVIYCYCNLDLAVTITKIVQGVLETTTTTTNFMID